MSTTYSSDSTVPQSTLAPSEGLICVSHREPFTRGGRGLERTTGGLVTALDSALRDLGGTWIACGNEEASLAAPVDELGRSYDIHHLGLSPRTVRAYYGGFSNQVLWPLFHYFIGRMRFDTGQWREYERANERFADAVVRTLGDDARTVWLHDYHLMLAPGFVRERAPQAAIGFFLHIPFPVREVFRVLPVHREILEGLLGADLIGFHAAGYQRAFLDCCRTLPDARVERTVVHFGGRRIETASAPIGIDVARQQVLARRPETLRRAGRLRAKVGAERIVLGVDRLDYSKGIIERLRGFEQLLETRADLRGRVTLVQIAVPSRTQVDEYRKLKRACDEEVGRINGRFATASWAPLRYLTRSFGAEELAAWYRAGDVALVTPLRDGLNLVAKEYVASRVDLTGALVLSEFAGAAEELDDAWFVNPFSTDSLADGLEKALEAPLDEASARMGRLARQVLRNDVNDWARRFLAKTDEAHARRLPTRH